jgi:tRNA-modifying protein YgfZ
MSGYDAAKTSLALWDRSRRVRVEVTGPDRAKFLHNLTTNDIKRLAVGSGVEAFVTSPQGKTLGHVTILAEDDKLLLRADAPQFPDVLAHLRKYGLFDDVAIDDVTSSTFELHLVGPRAEDVARGCCEQLPPDGELRHGTARPFCRLVRETILGAQGLTLIGPASEAESLARAIRHSGAVALDDASAEALRIEAGTPLFGRDVTPENLPQEVGRDDRAINFVKGCYLGQETVARLDALGHVNKILRGLRGIGDERSIPRDGAPIEADGKPVGKVTSAAFSPSAHGPVALAYVRTSHASPGSAVQVMAGDGWIEAVVTSLPMDASIAQREN